MRDTSNPDEAVRARLRVVMAGPVVPEDDSGVRRRTAPAARPSATAGATMTGSTTTGSAMAGASPPVVPAGGSPWAGGSTAGGRDDGWPPADEMPLSPVDASAAGDDASSTAPDPGSSTAGVPPWEREFSRPAPHPALPARSATAARDAGPSSATDASAASAGRLSGIGAFDPGRRGVKALAAVAAVVVLVAAVLAWRSRPHVEPLPPVPVAEAADVPGDPAGGTDSRAATTTTAAAGEVVIAVGGKVRRPGLVRLPPGARVADALQAAGGAEHGVDVALLNLARKVVDGELILVGVTPPPGTVVTGAAGPPAAGGGAPGGGPVNLNTATLADLDTLPGVGPVLAQRILDHREQQGGFRAVSDLRKVEGIGSSRYEQLKDLVTI